MWANKGAMMEKSLLEGPDPHFTKYIFWKKGFLKLMVVISVCNNVFIIYQGLWLMSIQSILHCWCSIRYAVNPDHTVQPLSSADSWTRHWCVSLFQLTRLDWLPLDMTLIQCDYLLQRNDSSSPFFFIWLPFIWDKYVWLELYFSSTFSPACEVVLCLYRFPSA